MSESEPRLPLARTVADAIMRDIAGAEPGWLPAMGVLCERYGVSRPTVVAAARILKENGVVELTQGRRMRIAPKPAAGENHLQATRFSSAELFSNFLQEKIEDGTYRVGYELPKQNYFAAQRGVSLRTIRCAYAILAGRGIIHRKGRGWVVGMETKRSPLVTRERAVIAVALRKESDWLGLHSSSRTRRFVEAFSGEAERFGVDIISAVFDKAAGRYLVPSIAAPAVPLDSAIRQIGAQYLGTLVADNTEETPELAAALSGVLEHLRPVVWFDKSGEGRGVPVRKNFARCRYCEESVVTVAISALSELGHRHLALVHPVDMEPWVLRRWNLLSTIGATLTQPVKAVIGQGFQEMGKDALRHLVRDLNVLCGRPTILAGYFRELIAAASLRPEIPLSSEAGGPGVRLMELIKFISARSPDGGFEGALGAYARLARITPMMLSVLRERDVTALIVSRDLLAFRCVQWLTASGIQIPRDMSVLSFDNTFGRRPQNLSSVDPGFGGLGYSAFHFIFGDIRPRCDQNGEVCARANVSRWGTLGQARIRDSGRTMV